MKSMSLVVLIIFFVCLEVFASSRAIQPVLEKFCRSTWCYYVETIEGWPVYYSDSLDSESATHFAQVRSRLKSDLRKITRLVPLSKIHDLQGTPIYISLFDPSGHYTLGVYHHSKDLLRERGHDPEKIRAIEIANTKNYLRTKNEMPAAVLHELGHAYRKKFITGALDEKLVSAYESAMKRGIYENVANFDGKKIRYKKAYAATDRSEYFCESIEAFFWRNDFFPFVREDLKSHDPLMFSLMQEIWGET